jgi:eukaryotic-like serine/threonine-protein kinase
MPARGERAWDLFDVARRRGLAFADDIDVPMPSAEAATSAVVAPAQPEVAPVAERSAAAATSARDAAPPSAIAAFARAGVERASGLARAAGAAARRSRATRGPATAAPPATSGLVTVPEAPKATPPTTRLPLGERLSQAGSRMSGSGRTAAMLLAVTMIAAVLSIWAESVRLGLLSELQRVGEISAAAYQQSEARQLLLAFTLLVFYVVSGIAFLVWIYRSYARLAARRISGLRYRPATAVIWFLIPLAFFFVPRVVVSDLWHANPLPEGGRVERRRRVPILITVWWTAFVAFAISAVLTSATTQNPTITDLFRQTWTNVASDTLALIAAGLAIAVISAIELRQAAAGKPSPGERARNAHRVK